MVQQQRGDVEARLHAPARVVKDRAAVVVHHSGVSAVGEDELHYLELRPAARRVEYRFRIFVASGHTEHTNMDTDTVSG